jgi:nucleotide-binding universal stress UspA family protein
MPEFAPPELPPVESVFHPFDHSEASERAFAHALAISLLRQTRLTILHAGPEHRHRKDWSRFPAVRATLERWKLLEPGSPPSAVLDELGIVVQKVAVPSRNRLAAYLDYLDENPNDLMVLASKARRESSRLARRSVAERMAQLSHTMSLFVPAGARGFVAVEDGRLSLRRILIPVDHHPSAQAAIEFATRAAGIMGDGDVEITLLHIGDSDPIAELTLPEDPRWTWTKRRRRGDALEGISAMVDVMRPDLIAMVTEGQEGVIDGMRRSVTERVLQRASCPLLTVPATWAEGAVR